MFRLGTAFGLGNADKDTTNISSMGLRFKIFKGMVDFQFA